MKHAGKGGRAISLGLALNLATLAAGAQDPEAPAPAPATAPASRPGETEVSLAGAKKDFETVKALRDFGTDAKDAPRLAIPRMPSAPPSALPPPNATGPTPGKPSANWLVDAMEKRPTSGGKREPEGGSAETRREWAGGRVEPRGDRREEPTETEADKERKLRGGPANPFARYLGDWISPQDYALLRPALDSSWSDKTMRSVSPLDRSTSDLLPFGLGSGGSLPQVTAPVGATARVGGLGGNPTVNPYLAGLEATQPTAAGGASLKGAGLPPPVPAPEIAAPPPVSPPPVSRDRAPDFLRPNNDEKYFKQLKRF